MPACPQTTTLPAFCVGGQVSPAACDPETAPDVRVQLRLVNANGAALQTSTFLYDPGTGIEYVPVTEVRDHIGTGGCWCICVPFGNYSSVDPANAIMPAADTWWEIQLQVGDAAAGTWRVVGRPRRFQIDADNDYTATCGGSAPLTGECGDCIPVQCLLDPTGAVATSPAGSVFCDAVMGCVQASIDGLQSQIDTLGGGTVDPFDPSGLQSQIDSLTADLAALGSHEHDPFDDSSLQSQIDSLTADLAALGSHEHDPFDDSSLQSQIDSLTADLTALTGHEHDPFDPSGLQSQIDALTADLAAVDVCGEVTANCPTTVVTNPDGSITIVGNDGSTGTIPAPPVDQPIVATAKQITNGPGPFAEGATIEYRIVASNSGPGDAVNVNVTDPDADQVTQTAGTVPAGAVDVVVATATRTVTAADVAALTVTNTASVVWESTDANLFAAQPSVTATTEQPQPLDLVMGKAVTNGPGPFAEGDVVVWDLNLLNNETEAATNLAALDPSADTVTTNVTEVPAAGFVAVAQATHTVTAAEAAAGTITNTATISGEVDGRAFTLEASDTVPTVVDLTLDFSVAKTAPLSTSTGGITIPAPTVPPLASTTITADTPVSAITIDGVGADIEQASFFVENTGASQETLQLGVFDSAGDQVGQSNTLPIVAGGPSPVTFLFDMAGDGPDTYTIAPIGGTMTASGNGQFAHYATSTDPSIESSTDGVTFTPTDGPLAGISGQFPNAAAPFRLGDTVEYEIEVTNTDTIPLSFISIEDANAPISGGDLATVLAPGETRTFVGTQTMGFGQIGEHTNTVTVGMTDGTLVGHETDSETITVVNPSSGGGGFGGGMPTGPFATASASLLAPGPYTEGDIIPMIVTVTNQGDDDATVDVFESGVGGGFGAISYPNGPIGFIQSGETRELYVEYVVQAGDAGLGAGSLNFIFDVMMTGNISTAMSQDSATLIVGPIV